MDRFPEAWVSVPLEGSLAFENVEYMISWKIPSYRDDYDQQAAFQCLLCDTGHLKSAKACREHCQGRRHQRQYAVLEQQQLAWLQEQQVPRNFWDSNFEENDEDILDYFQPFRRWHFGKWEIGLSCQWCGTAAFANRHAILQHCASSRRHIVLRNRTLFTAHHPEIHQNPELQRRLDNLPSLYRWRMERVLLGYLASKERAMASLQSKRYEWYQMLMSLQMYELRYQMSLLECGISCNMTTLECFGRLLNS